MTYFDPNRQLPNETPLVNPESTGPAKNDSENSGKSLIEVAKENLLSTTEQPQQPITEGKITIGEKKPGKVARLALKHELAIKAATDTSEGKTTPTQITNLGKNPASKQQVDAHRAPDHNYRLFSIVSEFSKIFQNLKNELGSPPSKIEESRLKERANEKANILCFSRNETAEVYNTNAIWTDLMETLCVDTGIPQGITKHNMETYLQNEIDSFTRDKPGVRDIPLMRTEADKLKNQLQKFSKLYQKEYPNVKPEELYTLLRDMARVAIFQVMKDRSYLTGSDHGVKHILHNCHHAGTMVKDAKGGGIPITDKTKLLAMVTHFFHDIGYTVGEQNFDAKKDHPYIGGGFINANREYFKHFFGADEALMIQKAIQHHSIICFDDKDLREARAMITPEVRKDLEDKENPINKMIQQLIDEERIISREKLQDIANKRNQINGDFNQNLTELSERKKQLTANGQTTEYVDQELVNVNEQISQLEDQHKAALDLLEKESEGCFEMEIPISEKDAEAHIAILWPKLKNQLGSAIGGYTKELCKNRLELYITKQYLDHSILRIFTSQSDACAVAGDEKAQDIWIKNPRLLFPVAKLRLFLLKQPDYAQKFTPSIFKDSQNLKKAFPSINLSDVPADQIKTLNRSNFESNDRGRLDFEAYQVYVGILNDCSNIIDENPILSIQEKKDYKAAINESFGSMGSAIVEAQFAMILKSVGVEVNNQVMRPVIEMCSDLTGSLLGPLFTEGNMGKLANDEFGVPKDEIVKHVKELESVREKIQTLKNELDNPPEAQSSNYHQTRIDEIAELEETQKVIENELVKVIISMGQPTKIANPEIGKVCAEIQKAYDTCLPLKAREILHQIYTEVSNVQRELVQSKASHLGEEKKQNFLAAITILTGQLAGDLPEEILHKFIVIAELISNDENLTAEKINNILTIISIIQQESTTPEEREAWKLPPLVIEENS